MSFFCCHLANTNSSMEFARNRFCHFLVQVLLLSLFFFFISSGHSEPYKNTLLSVSVCVRARQDSTTKTRLHNMLNRGVSVRSFFFFCCFLLYCSLCRSVPMLGASSTLSVWIQFSPYELWCWSEWGKAKYHFPLPIIYCLSVYLKHLSHILFGMLWILPVLLLLLLDSDAAGAPLFMVAAATITTTVATAIATVHLYISTGLNIRKVFVGTSHCIANE